MVMHHYMCNQLLMIFILGYIIIIFLIVICNNTPLSGKTARWRFGAAVKVSWNNPVLFMGRPHRCLPYCNPVTTTNTVCVWHMTYRTAFLPAFSLRSLTEKRSLILWHPQMVRCVFFFFFCKPYYDKLFSKQMFDVCVLMDLKLKVDRVMCEYLQSSAGGGLKVYKVKSDCWSLN